MCTMRRFVFSLSSPFSACRRRRRLPSTRHESIIRGGPNTVLMIRWTLASERVREKKEKRDSAALIMREQEKI